MTTNDTCNSNLFSVVGSHCYKLFTKPCLQPSMQSAKLTISWHFLNEIEMQVLTYNLVNIINFHGEKLSAICSVFIRYTLTHQMMPGSLLLRRRTQLKPEMLRKPFYLIIVFLNILVLYLYIVEQELHSLPEHLSSQPVCIYSGAGTTFPSGAPEFTTVCIYSGAGTTFPAGAPEFTTGLYI